MAVGSLFRKALFAVKFKEGNLLLSDLVNSNSKILWDRTPRERVDQGGAVADASTATPTPPWSTAGSSGSSTATRRPTATPTRSARRSADATQDTLTQNTAREQRGRAATSDRSTTSATR